MWGCQLLSPDSVTSEGISQSRQHFFGKRFFLP
jgi:hypothetical protein